MPVISSLPGLPDDYTQQFFPGDLVSLKDNSKYRGKVLRVWTEEDHLPPPVPHQHPLDRELLRGEVGIINTLDGKPSIVPESTLSLRTREYIKGDIVKRSLTSIESAVVVDMRTELLLEHSVSKVQAKDWVPQEKTTNAMPFEARDRVVFDEWIGTVEEVFEDGLIESRSGICYKLAEMGGMLEPGRLVADLIPKDPMFRHMEQQLPSFADPASDKVVMVSPVVVCISWNAINQQLPISEQDKHPEPGKFWYGGNIQKLTVFEGMFRDPPPPGSLVVFCDESDDKKYGVPPTKHIKGSINCRVLRVIQTRSRVHLLWQDGRRTEEWATDLLPYHNIDDYESWPGEHLVWRGDEGERRHVVVQSYNPQQRTAEVLFTDTKEIQTVSVLELDSGAINTNFGVGVGQDVLLCADNGAPIPEVPTIGQFDTPADGLNWRSELSALADRYIQKPEEFDSVPPAGDPAKVEWWGEVVNLRLNGMVDVMLPSGQTRTVSIKELQTLDEPTPDMGDGFDDDEMMMVDEDGVEWSSDASWETTSVEERPVNGVHDIDLDEVEEDGDGDDDEDMMSEEGRDIEEVDPLMSPTKEFKPIRRMSPPPTAVSPISATLTNGTGASEGGQSDAGPSRPSNGHRAVSTNGEDDQWQSFEILEEAPSDHHFFGEPSVSVGNRAFHSRMQREHRALMTSLPENILVRTYEDRTDLMRVLIIGPEGTPYANAPFVFDIYLHPNNFPRDPPVVHFHSHTNGKGRCNPNLYEEGKVCLSILGTWTGDKSESWSEKKSSLLQVFVSISGLVLVRSPYHCEPAFAKLEGTREGKINSRLYSEKAYVLSRSFVKQALDHPPSSFEAEIQYYYLTRGKLREVISHARALMDKAQDRGKDGEEVEENEEMWNADAVGSLTVGAILSLKRTIASLEKIALDYEGSSSRIA